MYSSAPRGKIICILRLSSDRRELSFGASCTRLTSDHAVERISWSPLKRRLQEFPELSKLVCSLVLYDKIHADVGRHVVVRVVAASVGVHGDPGRRQAQSLSLKIAIGSRCIRSGGSAPAKHVTNIMLMLRIGDGMSVRGYLARNEGMPRLATRFS